MLILGAALWPSQSAAKAKPRPLFWGAIIGDEFTGTPPPWDMEAAVDFAKSVGKSPSLLQFSAPFSECTPAGQCSFYGFPTLAMQSIRSYGAIPFFNWAAQAIPAKPEEAAFRLRRIANGSMDPFIRNFAEDAAEWGHPFFLRFNWEMNGFWFQWSPGLNHNTAHDYIAAWRHVWRIFQEVGATNATWVWCPNVDFTRKLTPLKSVYPGNRYVDWTCLDGFNWGKTGNSIGWQSFNHIFSSTYKRVVKIAPHKPMVIGETASEERGGSKAQWIRNMLNVVPAQYPKVRGLIYFDYKDQNMNWPLSSSKAANNAFRRGIKPAYWVSNAYSGLPAGRIKPPTWHAPPPEPPGTQPLG
ncbi:MAG TPA: glycosyl hydrolase [Solirubrobacterales bacterium]|nr:glycosyl hydrolase [Solirubrobacterales bacterium]